MPSAAPSYFTTQVEGVGVDLIAGQVELCQTTHHTPNLRFQEADAQNLPLADGSFDVVSNSDSSHWDHAIWQMVRV